MTSEKEEISFWGLEHSMTMLHHQSVREQVAVEGGGAGGYSSRTTLPALG